MADAEGMALVDACFFVLITEILVAFVSNGDFRGLFDFCCIEHGHAAAKSGEYDPHHHTETCAGEDVNAGDSLCYSDRERVHPGQYVSLSDTIQGFKEILEGKHDEIPEGMFLNAGTIEEVVERFAARNK